MIWGIDISDYQGDFDMQRLRNEGFGFVILKATEGATWKSKYFAANLRRARAVGLGVAAYHYQRAGNSAQSQVDNITSMVPADVGVIPDVEAGGGDINLTRDIINRLRGRGYRIPLSYVPKWYWQQIGSPSLAGLPPLWQSHYPDNNGGPVSAIYGRVPASYWNGFGGLGIEILQFTSSSSAAGRAPIDGNAYRGDANQLAALLGGGVTQEVPDMDATQAQQLADLHEWLKPLPVETGPKDPVTGVTPTMTPNANWVLSGLFGQTFFGSNWGAGPSILSQLAKAADEEAVDPAAIQQAVTDAVSAANEQFLVQVHQAVLDALGEDNQGEAEDIVHRIGQLLGSPVPDPVTPPEGDQA